jgi:hypothetical protein
MVYNLTVTLANLSLAHKLPTGLIALSAFLDALRTLVKAFLYIIPT